MDAPFTDLRMASRELAPSRLLDPGMRRDDGVFLSLSKYPILLTRGGSAVPLFFQYPLHA